MSAETSAARLQRLLAMVPWIAAQDGPTLDEICRRFDVSREQLAADLEVVWLVGLPPYTPDALIDVVQEGDRVFIHYADVFAQPQRLTPDQAVALLSAGASVLALPGTEADGALARGVRKLAAVLGVEADQVLDVHLGGSDPQVLATLRQAVREHRRVHLDYWSYGRDSRTERDVDPYLIHAESGALYLLAHCHRAGGERRFRIDRVNEVTLLDEQFDPPAQHGSTTVFEADDDDPRVTLRLPASARWVLDAYPVEEHEDRPDGGFDVTLAIGEEQWLARLLVNLGADAQIVDAPEALADVGRRAAARVLDRYR